MPLPQPLTDQDKRMCATMSGVGDGASYARRVRDHLARGGSPNLYSCRPNHAHSLLGLACHKGLPDLVEELLHAGAWVHWPEESVPPRRWGEGGRRYEGVYLDPLCACLDMLGSYVNELSPKSKDSDLTPIGRYTTIAIALMRAGADPMRKDPSYRTWPMDRWQECLERDFLHETAQASFLALMRHIIDKHPAAVPHAARGQWKAMGFIAPSWARSRPALARQFQAMAQAIELSAAPMPRPPAMARPRL